MIDVFKYEKGNWYPHMSAADRLIWERFIDKYPDAYQQVQYDFHVGEAPPFNTLMDDGTDTNQDKLYRLRIDVVATNGTDIDIIEIKPKAGPSSLGQLKSYANLYSRDEEPAGKVSMLLITDQEMPNMDYLCKQENIKLIVI